MSNQVRRIFAILCLVAMLFTNLPTQVIGEAMGLPEMIENRQTEPAVPDNSSKEKTEEGRRSG